LLYGGGSMSLQEILAAIPRLSPQDIEETLRRECPNLEFEVREACAIELFRAVLKRHRVEEQSLSAMELESDRETLRNVLGEAAR
jgi:hypothetical protein